MSSLTAVRLSASLTVNDLEHSVTWYCDILGFTIAQRHPNAVSLRAGDDVRILLTQDNAALGADRAKGTGFSMMITTDHNIDELAQRITDAGGVLESPPVATPWGARMFRLRDPDGFRYTIASER